MGWFSGICSFVSSACSAVCSVASSVCKTICGAAVSLGSSLGSAVSAGLLILGTRLPDIVRTVDSVCTIVSAVAGLLGIKEPGRDEPWELAVKAEKAKDNFTPEDFASVQDYIKKLQQEVELAGAERDKFHSLTPEQRAGYKAVGSYLYTKAVNEKLGFDQSGLRNPELVGITVQTWVDLVKLQDKLSPAEFVACSKTLKSSHLSLDDFSHYLNGTASDIKTDRAVQKAVVEGLKENNPALTEAEIDRKLYELNIAD